VSNRCSFRRSIYYIRNEKVVLTPDLWQDIADAFEDAENSELAQALRAKLDVGPTASDALRWQNVSEERA
jgi:hypothetical protein